MPNRILKDSICVSDDINNLSWFEEVLYYRLIVNCDDYGLYDGRPAIIKNKLFPLKDKLTIATVKEAITKLATLGLVRPYEVSGRLYLSLPTWTKHQQIRAARPKFPKPEEMSEKEVENTLDITCNQMISSDINGNQPIANDCLNPNPNPNPNTNIKCTAGVRTRTRARTVPVPIPKSVKEVAEYCKSEGLEIDAQRFFDTYERQCWRLNGPNGSPIHDWRAIAKLWAKEGVDRSANAGKDTSFDLDDFFARAIAKSHALFEMQNDPSLDYDAAYELAYKKAKTQNQEVPS